MTYIMYLKKDNAEDFDYVDKDYWTCPFCDRWLSHDDCHECEDEIKYMKELAEGAEICQS